MKHCLESAGATASFAAGGDFAYVPPGHRGFELQQRGGKTVTGIPDQTPSLLPPSSTQCSCKEIYIFKCLVLIY